jgi:RNA polymerase sigma-70 factor (ECF subfamily)
MIEFTANTLACLMQQHRSELLRFLAQRVSCPETAQDIFQETFIRYNGYREKNSIENPRAFLFRIAANLATDYLRSHVHQAYHQPEQDYILVELEDPALSVEATVISQQELELLIQALQELPPKCRDVFIMLRLKHYSYAQVEQELGISSTMILKYLNRALTYCRERLEVEN